MLLGIARKRRLKNIMTLRRHIKTIGSDLRELNQRLSLELEISEAEKSKPNRITRLVAGARTVAKASVAVTGVAIAVVSGQSGGVVGAVGERVGHEILGAADWLSNPSGDIVAAYDERMKGAKLKLASVVKRTYKTQQNLAYYDGSLARLTARSVYHDLAVQWVVYAFVIAFPAIMVAIYLQKIQSALSSLWASI